MAKGSTAPARSRKGLLTCVLIAVVVIIGAVFVASAAAFFLLRNSHPPNEAFLTTIQAPISGTTVLRGEAVSIQVTSSYPRGVRRVDLYANGALIASKTSTLAGGSNPLVLAEGWTPPASGRILLIARATTQDGRHSDSAVVYLDVSTEQYHPVVNVNDLEQADGTLPSLEQLADSAGVSVGEILDLNPGLSSANTSASLPPDTEVTLPGAPPPEESEEAPPPAVPDAPLPPTDLTVTFTCTEATLQWTDNSHDETEFIVYRIDPGTSTIHQVVVLPPNTTTYVDTLVGFGTYTYMVTSIRGTAELLTPPVSGATADACAAPPPGALDLVLTLGSLETDNAFAGIHCYAAIISAGGVWERLPPGDFNGLAPSAGNLYQLSDMPNHGRYSLAHHSPSDALEFRLFCFGRNPPVVDYIGVINPVVPPEQWNGIVRMETSTDGLNGNYTLYYCLGPAAIPCAIPGVPPPSDPTWMTDPFLPPPTNLRLEPSFEGCADLPTPLERVICVFSGIPSGVPSLLWDWDGAPHYTEAELTGYHVVLRRLERQTGNAATVGEWDVLRRLDGTLPRVILDRMDRSVCGMTYAYNVSAVASNLRSSESVPVYYTTPDCFQPVDVTVTFNTLQMSADVDDCGDWGLMDSTLDSSGYLAVYGSENAFRFLLSDRDTTEGNTYTFTDLWGGSASLTVPVNNETQTVTILTRLHDEDNLFACRNEPDYCRVEFELPARSTADWTALNSDLTGSTSNLEGGCTVNVHVQGAIHP